MPSLLRPGNTFGGRYRLVAPLGSGATSTVWRAHDAKLGIEVALKLLRSSIEKKKLLSYFASEAALSQRMLSPHIVKLLDHGLEGEETPYLVYELLEGECLGDRVEREETLPLADCAPIVVQVCRALSRAHHVGVVHRDIKLDNVFLCTGRERIFVKVLDLGLAQFKTAAAPELPSSEISGTLEYLSPEVLLEGQPPDPRQDLYALGVLAYRCFTGRMPFPGESLVDVLLSLTKKKPVTPSTLRPTKPELARGLDSWFETALAHDPDDRFQTAHAMAEAFVQIYRPRTRTSMMPPPGTDSANSPPPGATMFPPPGATMFPPPGSSLLPKEIASAPALPESEPKLALDQHITRSTPPPAAPSTPPPPPPASTPPPPSLPSPLPIPRISLKPPKVPAADES
jgi:eukaryotic-like serine/threonine-protein kinase